MDYNWIIWLLVGIICLLVVVRVILIKFASTIPNFGDQEPYLIDNEMNYHSSKQWNNYQKKCKKLSAACKQSDIRMYKRNSNTYRDKEILSSNRLNFNPLRNVLCINIGNNSYADVEGSTTFDTFVTQLLQYGYIPTVIPELKSITVGGAIVGVGVESGSFKYGLVHESMIECDVLLSNGTIITCNNNKNNIYSDLFKGIPNSLGSLGYLLRIRMKIIKCKKYVYLRNIPCKNYDILATKICEEAETNKMIDFIDGIAYPNGTGRIITGQMMDNMDTLSIDKYAIYHKYIQNDKNMLIPIDKYIWRWDSDLFWCLQYEPILNNKYIRWYLSDTIMRSDVLRYFHKLIFGRDIIVQTKEQIDMGNNMYIQDIIVPKDYVLEWINFHFKEILYLNKTSNIQHPLWLCPTKGNTNDYSLIKVNEESINVNFGFWSTVKWDKNMVVDKFVENNLNKYKAFKWLYSVVMFKKDEFYKIYNGEEYFKLKKKYDKQHKIRGFYEKCTQK
eukprot:539805_1